MRNETTRESMDAFMHELAKRAPRRGTYRVCFVGGGTAVYLGWRRSSRDIDVHSEEDVVFRDIQAIKEQLHMNIEFARPEDFVPPLGGSSERHIHINTIGPIAFYHYDPYAQILSKIVRGFKRDMEDARAFVENELVDPAQLRSLVAAIPDAAFARYPTLSRSGIEQAVEAFLRTVQ
jgi:hypothetical protein